MDENQARLKTVIEDLHFLSETWDKTVKDSDLRRSSNILRRLLVNGDLYQAWRHTGRRKEPQISFFSLDRVLQAIPLDAIVLASAGGAHFENLQVAGVLVSKVPARQADLAAYTGPPIITRGLKSFLDSPAIVFHGVTISRQEIIQYAANCLGGVHFGIATARTDKRLAFLLLAWMHQHTQVAGKSVVFYEILSIGQALVSAPEIVEFCKSCGVELPSQALAPTPGPEVEISASSPSTLSLTRPDLVLVESAHFLGQLGDTLDQEHAQLLFDLALEKVNKALTLASSFEAYLVLGTICRVVAVRGLKPDPEKLLHESHDAFVRAEKFGVPSWELYHTWGLCLSALALRTSESEKAFELSTKAFGNAIFLMPACAESYRELGKAYADWSDIATNGAEELRKQAETNIRIAISLDASNPIAFCNLSAVLLSLAMNAKGERKQEIIDDARTAAMRAEELSNGKGAYNLACIEARAGAIIEARKWLELARQCGALPSIEHLKKDKDLQSLRDQPWFEKFIAA